MEEYVSRINRAVDYIERNISEEITLDDISRAANFSKFHFHRIFTALTGESIFQFILRLRLERAATKLIVNPRDSITKIAFDCGFSGSSHFARAFKKYFNMSASDWRSSNGSGESNNCITESNKGKYKSKDRQDSGDSPMYIDITNNETWRSNMKKGDFFNEESYSVDVREFEDMFAAYVRYVGPYQGDSDLFERMFNRLFTWAGPRNLLKFPETKVMSVYHDNPDITEEEKLRTSMCITVPENTEVSGDVGLMKIEGGKYAVAHFEIGADEYGRAWETVYGKWLPESGYQPDDKPCFEIYHGDPGEHPEGKHVVDICIPVKPL